MLQAGVARGIVRLVHSVIRFILGRRRQLIASNAADRIGKQLKATGLDNPSHRREIPAEVE
jgi:hypothetical protein